MAMESSRETGLSAISAGEGDGDVVAGNGDTAPCGLPGVSTACRTAVVFEEPGLTEDGQSIAPAATD